MYAHSGLKNDQTQWEFDTASPPALDVTADREYDAFGRTVASAGAWEGPLGYAGGFGYQSSSSNYNFQLLGHRYYDPETGRFLTRDPIKDGRNWYVYCANNPLSGVDPTGLRGATFGGYVVALFSIETWKLGLATGGAAVGSSLSMGFWDGGKYKTQPGFGGALALANFGTAIMPGGQATKVARGANGLAKFAKAKKPRGAGDNLPISQGPKDGSLVNETSPGKGTIRTYGPDGDAKPDYDFGHDHNGSGDPHAHDFDWSGKKPIRGPGRPLWEFE